MPFEELMKLVAQEPDDDSVTFGELSRRWDEPVGRIMDAIDALRVMAGEQTYVEWGSGMDVENE